MRKTKKSKAKSKAKDKVWYSKVLRELRKGTQEQLDRAVDEIQKLSWDLDDLIMDLNSRIKIDD